MSVQPYKSKIPKQRSPKFVPKYGHLGMTRKEKINYVNIRWDADKWHNHAGGNQACVGAVAKQCAKSPLYGTGSS